MERILLIGEDFIIPARLERRLLGVNIIVGD